jgi:membrane protease YdiL (CAAX protease family)
MFQNVRKYVRSAASVVGFYVIAMSLAAILSCVLFWGTNYLANQFSIGILQHFVDKGLGKFFSRARLISVAMLLPVFLRINGIRFTRDIWFVKVPLQRFLMVFSGGCIAMIGIMMMLAMHSDTTFSSNMSGFCTSTAGRILISALMVGLLEETFFRGVIMKFCWQKTDKIFAVIFTSLFFAYCHVELEHIPPVSPSDLTLFAGVRYLTPTLLKTFDCHNILNFVNLTLFGVILSMLVIKYRSLLYPIAFHSGSVFTMLCARKRVQISQNFQDHFVGIEILDTWTTFALQILIIAYLIYVLLPKKSKYATESDDSPKST